MMLNSHRSLCRGAAVLALIAVPCCALAGDDPVTAAGASLADPGMTGTVIGAQARTPAGIRRAADGRGDYGYTPPTPDGLDPSGTGQVGTGQIGADPDDPSSDPDILAYEAEEAAEAARDAGSDDPAHTPGTIREVSAAEALPRSIID